MVKYVRHLLISTLAVLTCNIALAGEQAILSIHTDKKVYDYTLEMLDQFPQHEIKTATPWTAEHRFTGPLLMDLLRDAGIADKQIRAAALNDYAVALDSELTAAYPVLLSTRMDGNTMRVRNKGPIWIIFPLQSHPELDNADVHGQMVWQLRRLAVNQ